MLELVKEQLCNSLSEDNLSIRDNIRKLSEKEFEEIKDLIKEKLTKFFYIESNNRDILKKIQDRLLVKEEKTLPDVFKIKNNLDINIKKMILLKIKYFINIKPKNTIFFGEYLSVDFVYENMKRDFPELKKEDLMEFIYYSNLYNFTQNFSGLMYKIPKEENKNLIHYIVKIFEMPNKYWKDLIHENSISFDKLYEKKNINMVIKQEDLIGLLVRSMRFNYDPEFNRIYYLGPKKN
jgi:hypothetical protein